MSETVEFGIRFSLIGLSVVFVVLFLIACLVALVRMLDVGWRERENKEGQEALRKPPTIDKTTIFIIASVAAAVLSRRARVRSVRRIMPGNPQKGRWSMYGRAVLHGSHVLKK